MQERKSTNEDHLNNLAKYEPRKDRATFLRGFSLMSDQPVAENRLVQVTFLNPQPANKVDTVQMTYDGMDRRTSITELHGTTVLTSKSLFWSGKNLCQERDSTGHTITKQFFNQGEQINGTNYYYAKDHLNNVREMTDSNGVVHANYDYDAFGRQTKLLGDLDSDFGYTGFYIERTLCLDFTKFRAYDPEKGRWLSRDPIAELGGNNVYSYVSNNVIEKIDLLGLCEACSGGGGGQSCVFLPQNPPFPNFNPGGSGGSSGPYYSVQTFDQTAYNWCFFTALLQGDNIKCYVLATGLGIGGCAKYGPWGGLSLAAILDLACGLAIAAECQQKATS